MVYGWSLAALAAAVAIRGLLDPVLDYDLPLVTLFGAVAFAAWLGGWRPAVLSAVLGFIACDYFFIAPRGSLSVPASEQLVGFIAYLVTCGLIIFFGESARLEHSRSEAAIEANELRFKTLTGYAPVGIFQSDTNGNCLFVNERWCELAGMTAGEARGQGWAAAIHPDDRERVANEWYAEVGKRRKFSSEYRFRRPDGEVSWLAGRAIALTDDSGTVIGYIGTVNDITDRKREQEQLREADRRKDQFLATLAHELRNPLAPIRNGLQILKIVDPQAEEAAEVREMMERQLDHMVRLVDDLLDISRITRNKLELRKERVELANVVASAVETSRPLIEANGHTFESRLPDEPIWLEADVTRLAQVLANLLNNAAKYMEAGGRIEVAAVRQSLPERGGTEVEIRVTDTGIGIPAEMLPRVFDMFTQVDETQNRSQGGLGVGLTLVRQLVEMHGGTIEARSEGLGRGSEFVVRLPAVAEEPKREMIEMSDSTNGGAGRRILVVDDNRDSAKTLGLLLKLMGHETHLAHDGVEAIAEAERVRPELILLDIGLPKMTGHEVCQAIRQQPWGEEMVIIAVTGWGQDDDRRKSQEAGFNGHLVKPVAPEVLKQLLADVVSGALGARSVAVG